MAFYPHEGVRYGSPSDGKAPTVIDLTDLLPPAAIRLDAHVNDWREALQAVGHLLVSTDTATPRYTQAMIDNLEKNGPYIVVAPGFALAHARPDSSVLRTGMSWMRLDEPVAFGHETNDPVTLVAGLAATDASAHQNVLAALASALADPNRRNALDTATTPQEVVSILSNEAGHRSAEASTSQNLLLTVCGNGLGTSLFLKNTTEQVLDAWAWTPYLSVEETDTISARGRCSEADAILTSGAIAQTLGELSIPVEVIDDFTSVSQVDAALRRIYDV